jgi:hypothetical protein
VCPARLLALMGMTHNHNSGTLPTDRRRQNLSTRGETRGMRRHGASLCFTLFCHHRHRHRKSTACLFVCLSVVFPTQTSFAPLYFRFLCICTPFTATALRSAQHDTYKGEQRRPALGGLRTASGPCLLQSVTEAFGIHAWGLGLHCVRPSFFFASNGTRASCGPGSYVGVPCGCAASQHKGGGTTLWLRLW